MNGKSYFVLFDKILENPSTLMKKRGAFREIKKMCYPSSFSSNQSILSNFVYRSPDKFEIFGIEKGCLNTCSDYNKKLTEVTESCGDISMFFSGTEVATKDWAVQCIETFPWENNGIVVIPVNDESSWSYIEGKGFYPNKELHSLEKLTYFSNKFSQALSNNKRPLLAGDICKFFREQKDYYFVGIICDLQNPDEYFFVKANNMVNGDYEHMSSTYYFKMENSADFWSSQIIACGVKKGTLEYNLLESQADCKPIELPQNHVYIIDRRVTKFGNPIRTYVIQSRDNNQTNTIGAN